jgi:hypothetical protein
MPPFERRIPVRGRSLLARFGEFDFVHCFGAIYRVPDSFSFIRNITSISRRCLVLTSTVTPSRIENREGNFDLPTGHFCSVLAQRV